MSGIVLSSSVRQNLLSLQSTADLLATTQNRLSTGKKVNSALDNPTNYFTAQGQPASASMMVRNEKRRRGVPRRLDCLSRRRAQRSNCNTACCEVLASASADTAIDWRVDSAWLFAASSLVSASVRFDEPVCSTLIRFFEKS